MSLLPEKILSFLITKTKRDKLIFWGYSAGVLAALFLFIFLPAKVRYDSAAAALSARQKEISLVKASGISQLTNNELAGMERKATLFKSGFITTSQVASALNHVSEQAERNHLKVLDIKVEQAVPVKTDAGGGALQIDGSKYSRLPIHIHLEAQYKPLGNFLRALEETSSNCYTVDSLRLRQPASKSEALDCQMTISFFSASG